MAVCRSTATRIPNHKKSILKSGRSGRNRGTQITRVMMISVHLSGLPMSKMINTAGQMKPVGDRLSPKTQLSIIFDPPRSAKTAAKTLEPTGRNNTMVKIQMASKMDPFRVVQFSAPISNLLRNFISFYHQAYRAAVWCSRHISLSSAENVSGAPA
jgi:hypothetical protein